MGTKYRYRVVILRLAVFTQYQSGLSKFVLKVWTISHRETTPFCLMIPTLSPSRLSAVSSLIRASIFYLFFDSQWRHGALIKVRICIRSAVVRWAVCSCVYKFYCDS